MKYRGIIFDLDGVICFTDRFHYQAWKKLADQLNIVFDETINNRLRGVSRMASLEIILEKADRVFTQTEKEALCEEKNDNYRKLLKTMGPDDLSEETRHTLIALRNRGYKLAIGSSSKNTKYILERIGLVGFFDVVIDGTDITHSKPHPEVFLTAAQKAGLEPEECVVVEDAKAGIQAAKKAKMTAFALHGDAENCGLEDKNLSSFTDLLSLL